MTSAKGGLERFLDIKIPFSYFITSILLILLNQVYIKSVIFNKYSASHSEKITFLIHCNLSTRDAMKKDNAMENNETPMIRIQEAESWCREACAELGFNQPKAKGRPIKFSSFAGRIEHTLLRADATEKDIGQLCSEAASFGFRSVCLFPKDVALAKRLVGGTAVLVVTVLNFPFSGSLGEVIESECGRVIEDGADEVDMVVDVRALSRGDLRAVRDGVGGIVNAASGRPVKVILETGYFSARQVVLGSIAAQAGGAQWVKTSTGFGPRGASVEDVISMRAAVGDGIGIKASGGIRHREFAQQLVDAGADLIGTSSGPHLIAAIS
jgi:deoxyribose-phosphate aldolase